MNCCTDLYQHPLTHHLLGDSFHPGGLETTRSLAVQCLVNRTSKVLDIATGRATSAAFLVKQYGAQVLGLDLGMDNLQTAKQMHRSLTKLRLISGDAMQLPFRDNSLDVVFCECALCTFDNRDAAMPRCRRSTACSNPAGLSRYLTYSSIKLCLANWKRHSIAGSVLLVH